jgi:OPA family sugar phosphate sensor protein UhpC-like MFS transporter
LRWWNKNSIFYYNRIIVSTGVGRDASSLESLDRPPDPRGVAPMNGLLRFFAASPEQPLRTDPQEIDALYRRHRLRVMLAITIGYGLVYTCRLAIGVVKKPLIDEGIFTPAELGQIGAALFYTYALGKLVNGFLADHANIRVFFATGVLLSALINIAMGWSTILWVSILLWALNGWFQGFGAPSGVVSLASWFSNRERGRYYGIWSTAHSIGEGLTFVAVAALVSAFGWRYGFWGPGVLCIGVTIGLAWLLQDRPRSDCRPSRNGRTIAGKRLPTPSGSAGTASSPCSCRS